MLGAKLGNTTIFSLDDFRWKNRILLVLADENSKMAEQQMQVLIQSPEELEERHLLLLRVTPEQISDWSAKQDLSFDAREVWQEYGSDGPFTLVLIGKDGGTKLRSSEIVPPLRIFTLIDSMPMRRQEMRSQNQQ